MEEQTNKLFEKTMLITFYKIGAEMINAIMLTLTPLHPNRNSSYL